MIVRCAKPCWKAICTQLDAAPVQHIGKILVIYKPNPEAHQIELKKMPRHKGKKPLTKKQLGNRVTCISLKVASVA